MNKRLQNRKGIATILVDIFDGTDSFPVAAYNISYSGITLEGVLPAFDLYDTLFSLTVSSSNQQYLLRAILRWASEEGQRKTIGLRIFSVPRNWFQFVDNL